MALEHEKTTLFYLEWVFKKFIEINNKLTLNLYKVTNN